MDSSCLINKDECFNRILIVLEVHESVYVLLNCQSLDQIYTCRGVRLCLNGNCLESENSTQEFYNKAPPQHKKSFALHLQTNQRID